MNLATGLEVILSTLYPGVPSPQAPSPVVTSILGRAVPAVDAPVPAVQDVPARVVQGALVRAVIDQAPVVGVIDCWSQTWAMTSQKNLRSILCLSPNRLHQLKICLSNNNNGGSVPRRRRRGCTRVPSLVLNRYKASSRYLPLNRVRRFIRYVGFAVHTHTANSASARRTCRCRSNFGRSQCPTATLEYRGAGETTVV